MGLLISVLGIGATVSVGVTTGATFLTQTYWQQLWRTAVQHQSVEQATGIDQRDPSKIPLWFRLTRNDLHGRKFNKACDAVKCDLRAADDNDIVPELIRVKFLPEQLGQFIVFPHGCGSLRDLLLVINFYAAYGPLLIRTQLQSYDWLIDKQDLVRRRLLLADHTPIPTYSCAYFSVSPTSIGLASFPELLNLNTFLFASWLIETSDLGNNPLFGTNITPLKYVDFACCSGWNFNIHSLKYPSPAALRDCIATYGLHDGLFTPQAYSSSSGQVVITTFGAWMLGFAPNIYQNVCFAQAWEVHGVQPDQAIALTCMVGNPMTARWPNHFTSWVGALDLDILGSIGPHCNDGINAVVLLQGTDARLVPVEDKPSTWQTQIQWGRRCPSNHVMHQSTECEVCSMLLHENVVEVSDYIASMLPRGIPRDWPNQLRCVSDQNLTPGFRQILILSGIHSDWSLSEVDWKENYDRLWLTRKGDNNIIEFNSDQTGAVRDLSNTTLNRRPAHHHHDLFVTHYINFFGLGSVTYKCNFCQLTADVGHHHDQIQDVHAKIRRSCFGTLH
jgi:hypothetical protein